MSSFITKLQKRLAQEESGFTLIELLIVLVIIGILLAIAVPSYLGFKDRANKTAAQANVRSSIPAAETFYADNNTYTGIDVPALKSIDAGIGVDSAVPAGGGAQYTLCAASGSWKATVTGPGGSIQATKVSGTATCP